MHATDVIAYVGDGEIVCPDCADVDNDQPIFADTEDTELYCSGCDRYYDWDWGGWLQVDRRPRPIIELEEAVHGH